MKLLVTGGYGFIGSNFIKHTLSKYPDYKILNIDKIGKGANPKNLESVKADRRYNFLMADICDLKIMRKALTDVNIVLNFAAETHVDRSISDPLPFLDSNIFGTYTLLEAERKLEHQIKHIQISTDEVYGTILEGAFSEDDVLKPSNPYSATKAAADMLCNAYTTTYGLDASITRCTNNYGPCQFPEKLIPKTIIRAMKDMNVPIYGSGKNVRDYLYVLDHCEAIHRIIENGKPGKIYNISSGYEFSVLAVVKKILKYLDKPEEMIEFVDDRPGHDERYSLDSSKIRVELGWKPKYDFESTLRLTVDWYASNQEWWKPLINKRILHPTPWKNKEF